MYTKLVILQFLGSLFTWDKVLRPLTNRVKNQRLLVHILNYISFNYLGEISKTMFEYVKIIQRAFLPNLYNSGVGFINQLYFQRNVS